MVDRYVKGNEASKILRVHQRTLYQWEEKGWIETKRSKGGIRLYNVDKYLREIEKSKKNAEEENIDEENNNIEENDVENEIDLSKLKKKISISYVRVSSNLQKNDLERQEKMMKDIYPNNIIIRDIGSGINMNRRGLRKIIDLAIEGKVQQVVVAHKDRLTRFGYELIEDIIKKYSGGKIEVLNREKDTAPEEELAKDVLQIMNVFVAKMNGMRKYKTSEMPRKKKITKKVKVHV